MNNTEKNHSFDYVSLLILAIIWSLSFTLIRVGVTTIGPVTLTAGRLTIASILLFLWLALNRQSLPLGKDSLKLYLVVGIFANTLPFMLISWGETHISSSLAAILMGIMPISTFILAHFFIPDEPITGRKTIGIVLGFVGLITLVGFSTLTGLEGSLLGQLAVLCGALFYSLTTVFVRKQVFTSGLKMATGATFIGALSSVVLAFTLENPLSMTPNYQSVLSVLALGIFPTAIASIIYFKLIQNLGATTFSQINYIIPVLGSLWGVLFLNEMLEWTMALSLGLVLTGIYLIQSRKHSTTS